MNMKRTNYIKPACAVILLNQDLMESLPTGTGTTDSGDTGQPDGGGGLAKPGFFFGTNQDESDTKNYHAWEDD